MPWHLIVALFVQAAIGLLTGDWWAGAAAGAALFIGREQAQAEYRWIETYGKQRRANMPWWGGFDPRVWHGLHSWTDWLVPSFAVVLCAKLA